MGDAVKEIVAWVVVILAACAFGLLSAIATHTPQAEQPTEFR